MDIIESTAKHSWRIEKSTEKNATLRNGIDQDLLHYDHIIVCQLRDQYFVASAWISMWKAMTTWWRAAWWFKMDNGSTSSSVWSRLMLPSDTMVLNAACTRNQWASRAKLEFGFLWSDDKRFSLSSFFHMNRVDCKWSSVNWEQL